MSKIQTFKDFRARPFLIEQIMRPVKTGRIVHAQLYAGPDGTGKKTAALLFARAVNCTGDGEKPCNHCPSCLQFLSGNSPNLLFVSQEKNVIRVNAIREMIEKIHLRPNEGKMCVIIDQADRMNENAQNALLKTLEEAPEYAVFLLLTDKPGVLLPTIRSRCALYRFAPLDEETVSEALIDMGVSEERAKETMFVSSGSIGLALERLNDEAFQEVSSRAMRALLSIKKPSDVSGAFQMIANDKEYGARILEIYESTAERLMKYAASGAGSKEAEQLFRNGVSGAKLMENVVECAKKLKANVSFQSAMEMLFFDIVNQED